MPQPESTSWVTIWRGVPNDHPLKIVVVAMLLCLCCSIVVSTAAVQLRPVQQANRDLDRKRNILEVAGLLSADRSLEMQFEQVEVRLVDIAAGVYTKEYAAATFDQRAAAKDPKLGITLNAEQDIAKIGRRARFAKVYLVHEGAQLQRIILPVHGYGLWSTLYGYLALEGDLSTVYGLKFYQHAETPGLGGEVDNPKWRAMWRGKPLYGEQGELRLQVAKAKASSKYEVDGLAGATLTSRGVSNMLQYWLGDDGFGPFLSQQRKQLR